ncbi:hypothetical protein RND81_11G034200 [Saponaria officinalis]|uniref:Uncharacterized protein n=1 Tax=Saponaria officinalis TaxID=3572 RepID=A0AAW1HGH8_SAPOF
MMKQQTKERRIVTWSQEEDDILKDQISIHGTENWTIIASMFKDKTTRQCRRRWYTYVNCDSKKGGWSPEEDVLLCEAQKIFGNRWTEIAKVVSGRTDNAVKNRFSTLCKKKRKREALTNENRHKRVLVDNESCSSLKKSRRSRIPSCVENIVSRQLRVPFAVLSQDDDSNAENLLVSTTVDGVINVSQKWEGAYFRKDDSKESHKNALTVLRKYFDENKASDELKCKITDVNMEIDEFKILTEDLITDKEGIQQHPRYWHWPLDTVYRVGACRQPDTHGSSSSSECSTESMSVSHAAADQMEQSQPEKCTSSEEIGTSAQSLQVGNSGCIDVTAETNSPTQVTPIFRSLATTVPSPQFSESERHFLLKTLGIDSPAHNSSSNPSQPPPCRKALLQGL